MCRITFPSVLALVLGLASRPLLAESVVLTSSKDNTLIEFPPGGASNGAGPVVAAGRVRGIAFFSLRRAVLAFDIAGSVPAGSTIDSVTLSLSVTMVASPDAQDFTLHLLTQSWGEGTSFSTGGAGAISTPNDATWLHRFYDTVFWTTAGGDFVATSSASTSVADLGSYSWSSAQMAADVQAWLDSPATNNGWILLGNEAQNQTAKIFGSRENTTAALRPQLVIQYTPPCASAAVSFRNGGSNPASYSATAPVLGGTFVAAVDNNVAGEITSLLFAFEAPASLTLGGGQTLLCNDTGSGELLTGAGAAPTSSAGGVDTYSLPVPDLPATCGIPLYTQAIQFGIPPFRLSNAQDLTLGL